MPRKKGKNSKGHKMNRPLLERIPDERLTRQQENCRPYRHKVYLPIYKLTREPTSLDEFEWETYHDVVIWRENGTAILICKKAHHKKWGGKVSFTVHVGKYQLGGAIFTVADHADDCDRDEAKALETFTFFASLKPFGESNIRLEIDLKDFTSDWDFDFAAALTSKQLACIIDASPNRQLAFRAGDWSAEQSVILATRPFRLDLKLGQSTHGYDYFKLQDEGTAFVKALETRQSSFGSLCLKFESSGDGYWTPFSSANLKRLFNLDTTFEQLKLSMLEEEVALLPFSSKTRALTYEIDLNCFQESDFDSLNILTQDLSIKVTFLGHRVLDNGDLDNDYNHNWDRRLISFLKRLAEFDHLTRLKISVYCDEKILLEKVKGVADALITVIKRHPSLAYLDISARSWLLDWTPQMEHIFKATEEHRGLRTLVVERYPQDDSNYSWLKRLLSRNRNITVFDSSGRKCSDGSTINKLYALNRFYNGSLDLVKESELWRASLV